MANKLPALHFYTGDWWKDPGIMALNYGERGVWVQMLFLMHESKERGRLSLNDKPYPIKDLARVINVNPKMLQKIIQKLIDVDIVSIENDTKILYSRRMILDEEKRQALVKAGEKGGRGNKKEKAPLFKKEKEVSEDEVEDESEKGKGLLNNEQKKEQFEIRWKRYKGEKDGKKLAKGHWNASILKTEDIDRYDQAEFNYYAIVEADRKNGFPTRKLKGAKTWFNNWESYVDQKPPPKKTVDGIQPKRDLAKDELKADIYKKMEFVQGEINSGELRDYMWLYMSVGKYIIEFERRFGEDPLNDQHKEFYYSLRTEYEQQETI